MLLPRWNTWLLITLRNGSISQVSRQARSSLLTCIDVSSDHQLQELGLQLHLGDAYLQTRASGYSILSESE